MSLPSTWRLVLWSIIWALIGMMLCNVIGSFYIELNVGPGAEPTPAVLHDGLVVGFISYMVILAGLMIYMTTRQGVSNRLRRNLFNLLPIIIFVTTPPLHWRLSILLLIIVLAMATYQALVIRHRHQDSVNGQADELRREMERRERQRRPRR